MQVESRESGWNFVVIVVVVVVDGVGIGRHSQNSQRGGVRLTHLFRSDSPDSGVFQWILVVPMESSGSLAGLL